MQKFARSIVETVRHPMVVMDADSRIVSVNNAFYQAFRTTEAETLHRSLFEISNGIWDTPGLRTLLNEALRSDVPVEGCEMERDVGDTDWQLLVLNARRVSRDEDGSPMVLLAIEDGTLRRRARDDLVSQNAELQGAFALQADALRVANKGRSEAVLDLAAVNRELEAFCYSVSHDLRAPLRAIDGFSLELLERHAEQLDPQGLHYLRRIRAGTQRMGQLIDDLRALSRASRQEMHREPVDLTQVAHTVVADLRELEPHRAVDFFVDAELVTDCDRRLVQIVVANLLENAWKFTAKKANAGVEFRRTQSRGQSVFVVRDNG
ncbi:MAG TPA: histidine kinase dimerization/phospho-acceptor domain-containing protein, partial [Pirellulales bacterium]|nr:histidine kinase dimerization/phospho-acceptor domain-containing protein [Pirellulales bacterium]